MNSLIRELKNFVQERDWEKFHSPKNLAMALNIESGELLEIFLWLTEKESYSLPEKKIESLKDEIGDVLIYLLLLADKFNIDPIECVKNKIRKNEIKYPIDLVKGKAKKYTEYTP
jgi:NTP pyrophosphatase (non-canonical NTP hydrolase)